jgi:hypothetical protein
MSHNLRLCTQKDSAIAWITGIVLLDRLIAIFGDTHQKINDRALRPLNN